MGEHAADHAPVPDPLALPTCVARALIGWMTPEEGALVLGGRIVGEVPNANLVARVQAARDAVAARDGAIDQDGLLQDAPPELGDFVARIQAQPNAAPYVNEGWEVRIADLSRVCSLQQQVHSEHAAERVVAIDPEEVESIAQVTLPIPTPTPLPIMFDEARNIWMVPGANPNLRIVGNFQAEVGGMPGIGFVVGVSPSFMQVALHHGRYVLRDGYHRSFGLLSRGVTHAPVFFRDFGVGELGVGPGLFPTDVYLGQRPRSWRISLMTWSPRTFGFQLHRRCS